MTDPRPSIAELQRLVPADRRRCGTPDGKCAGAPKTADEQAEDDADLARAAPVLLEIAAAALAVRDAVCDGRFCHHPSHRAPCSLMDANSAFDNALDKVDP